MFTSCVISHSIVHREVSVQKCYDIAKLCIHSLPSRRVFNPSRISVYLDLSLCISILHYKFSEQIELGYQE